MVATFKVEDPRWARTRSSLIKGGRRVIADKGVKAATILEIVREARVSQPSFYNHFDSKDQLLDAIAADFFQSDAAFKVRVFDQVDDPAEAIAINARHTLRVATHDPIVAQIIVHASAGRNLLRTSNSDELAAMIAVGVKRRRFHDIDPRIAALTIRGAAFPLMQEIVEGNVAKTVEQDFAELVLRMLGLDREEAHEVSRRPDPVLFEVTETASVAGG